MKELKKQPFLSQAKLNLANKCAIVGIGAIDVLEYKYCI